MAFWSKKLILAVLLLSSEIISFVLDRIGGSNRLFLVASCLLSAIGFVTTIYTSFFSSTVPAVTRSESERQLIAVDIVFSFIQLVLTYIQLIRVFLSAKSNNDNNESLLPLAFAVISVVFIFRNNEEAHVFSDLESVYQIISTATPAVGDESAIDGESNNDEAQVVSDSASVSHIISPGTPEVDESAINPESNNEEAQVVSDSVFLGTPAGDESAINQESSTLRRRITSTRSEIMAQNNFEIPKILAESDVRTTIAIPVSIVWHMVPAMKNGENSVDLMDVDRWGQQWPLKYYTRPTHRRNFKKKDQLKNCRRRSWCRG